MGLFLGLCNRSIVQPGCQLRTNFDAVLSFGIEKAVRPRLEDFMKLVLNEV